nr:hypothetical protein [Tanacetum cinerariifolium]
DGQQGGNRRRHGAQQGLRGRDVDVLDQRCLAQQAEVLTNPVEYHDGVVERVADDREHRGQYRQVKGHLEERQDTHGHDHVVDQRDNRTDRELPLETEGQVDQYAAQREQHA